MINKEIEEARSNIVRGTDIESSVKILEAVILNGYIIQGRKS